LEGLDLSAACTGDVRSGRFERCRVAGHERHMRAFLGKLATDCLADAAAAAGDDSDLALELEIHVSAPLLDCVSSQWSVGNEGRPCQSLRKLGRSAASGGLEAGRHGVLLGAEPALAARLLDAAALVVR